LPTFLETLYPGQWRDLPLCTEWTVHQLVAHVISYEELSRVGLAARFAKGWLMADRVITVGVWVRRPHTTELVALVRAYAVPRDSPPDSEEP
jgi:Mycothiol maleylpyruvate isomerase N-terminal domain